MSRPFLLLVPVSILGFGCFIEAEGPKSYDALWTQGNVFVDGELSEEAWIAAPWTDEFVDILGTAGPPPTFRTRAKILWNEEYLFVGAEMEEPHLWATLTDRDAIVYRDDDFEVFLDPDRDGQNYFEIEVNPLGTVLDLFLAKPYRQGGTAEIQWDLPGLQVGVSLSGTLNNPSDIDEGWSVELAIPWAELEHPDLGDIWRINFSRVDWPLEVVQGAYQKAATPSPDNPHPESNWVWSPQGIIDMHLPEMWGLVRFVAEPQNSSFTMSS